MAGALLWVLSPQVATTLILSRVLSLSSLHFQVCQLQMAVNTWDWTQDKELGKRTSLIRSAREELVTDHACLWVQVSFWRQLCFLRPRAVNRSQRAGLG